MIVFTDIDGVVLDWEESFTCWMEHRGHMPRDDFKDHYDVGLRYGMEKAVSKKLVEQFNSSAAIGFLPPLRDAQWHIKLMHEKHKVQFIAVTSLSDDPYAQKLRVRNLAKLFGDNVFKEVICLPCGADKDDILEHLSECYPGHYWIEDKAENARVGADLGFKTLLMEHKYNMLESGNFSMVRNWSDIYERICP